MITYTEMLKRVKQLKDLIDDRYDEGSYLHNEFIKAINMIPVGWRITDRVRCEMKDDLVSPRNK